MNHLQKDEISTDYTDRCGNCHQKIDPNFKYCTNCGTRRGEGAFEPYRNEAFVLYGCPTHYYFRCDECGHEWDEISFSLSRYCPNCGRSIRESNLLKTVDTIFGMDIEEWTVHYRD